VAEKSELIRSDIERTRAEMGDTVDALGYKANVPARTKDWVADKRDSVVSAVSGMTPDGEDVKRRSLRMKDTAERNPLGLTLAGAAVGFVAGLLAPSTRMEDEKVGPLADEVKSSAAEAGQEALEHGKQVAQAAAGSAVETAKEQGREHGEELTSSLQDKAHDVAPGGSDEHDETSEWSTPPAPTGTRGTSGRIPPR
jgi:hypothetical protein